MPSIFEWVHLSSSQGERNFHLAPFILLLLWKMSRRLFRWILWLLEPVSHYRRDFSQLDCIKMGWILFWWSIPILINKCSLFIFDFDVTTSSQVDFMTFWACLLLQTRLQSAKWDEFWFDKEFLFWSKHVVYYICLRWSKNLRCDNNEGLKDVHTCD